MMASTNREHLSRLITFPLVRCPEREYRKGILAKHGDTPLNRSFLKQCVYTADKLKKG
jgi:hypothetical protein